MKIVTSDLRMDASTAYREVHGQAEWMSGNRRTAGTDDPVFQLKLPVTAAGSMERHAVRSSMEARSTVGTAGSLADYALNQHEIRSSVSGGLGRTIRAGEMKQNDREAGGAAPTREEPEMLPATAFPSLYNVTSSRSSIDYSWEKYSASASGNVSTADGRSIAFSLDMSLEREDLTIRNQLERSAAGVFLDPLVLSFDNGIDVLSDSVFSFDLDGDGSAEKLAGLRGGSGFLGIDLNGDNMFNDGTELFGPRTGYAFDELRVYDEDGNNWLDENDPVFAKLALWMGAGGEDERMVSLKEAGVGALALASTENQFSLKNSEGRVVGRIDRSGLFLMENGEVRSLQEIDLQNIEEDGESTGNPHTVETMPQALVFLKRLILLRRHQLAQMVMLRSAVFGRMEKEMNLAERFWAWQENNQDNRNLVAQKTEQMI